HIQGRASQNFVSMNHLISTVRSIVLLVSLLLAALAASSFAQQPGAPAPPIASPSVQSDLSKRQEAFQIVWQTVNDLFYDPKFGGVDWAQARERYQPQVAMAGNDREFHLLLQQMLNELHQSHFMVVPREAIPKIRVTKEHLDGKEEGPDASGSEELEPEEPLDSLSYKLTDR